MGRMNDIEKKKTLFQVLSRLKETYLKYQLFIEWTRVLNEHLTLKTIKFNSKVSKDNLNKLIGGIYFNSNNLLKRKHNEIRFKAFKDLLTISKRVPSYFAPSIEALAPEKLDSLNEKEKNSWLSTLESLLRTEITRNIINIAKKDYKILSIDEGKVKILFLNLFEFEFTLVPAINNNPCACDSNWFILGVKVDSMKGIFKNSLTGIFQFKYNNKSVSDSFYFKSIISDCSKYIELFYYEKMFSQFSFISNFYGKSICSFQKSQTGDWFKFKPWFMSSDELVSFSNDSCFKVEGESKSLMIPSLSFKEQEAKNTFEQLFSLFYQSKLIEFLEDEKRKGFINNFFIVENQFTFNIEVFEGFSLIFVINPFTKNMKFQLIDEKFEALNFVDNFEEELELALINFNFELFNEILSEIKKEIVSKLIKTNVNYSLIKCSEINGICLQLRKSPNLAFSLNFNPSGNIEIRFWNVSYNFQNGFIEIKYKEISDSGNNDSGNSNNFNKNSDRIDDNSETSCNSNSEQSGIVGTVQMLNSLLRNQERSLLEISSNFSFENLIKTCGIEGEFLGKNVFNILSIGLPNCIKRILLSSEEAEGQGLKVEIELLGLKQENIIVQASDIKKLLNNLKGNVKLLTIFEHFNLLTEFAESDDFFVIKNFEPLKLKYQQTSFYLNNENGQVKVDGYVGHLSDLELFINSDEFNIYDFVDKLLNREIKENVQEASPDLTWLSDSFM